MMEVIICQKMGWDYYTYIHQPTWFLELIRIKLKIDNEKANKKYANR